MNKKSIGIFVNNLLKKNNFPEKFLTAVSLTASLMLIIAMIMANTYIKTAEYTLFLMAVELTGSALGTLAVGLGGYFCFKRIIKISESKEN